MNQELMAFWKYDLYPYLLCGTVVSIDDKGYAFISEYGGYFNVDFILPIETGKKLKEKLELLRSKKRTAINSVDVEYDVYLNDLLLEYKK